MPNIRKFFVEYKPRDDAETPLDYPYMIMADFLLTVIRSSWPDKLKSESRPSVIFHKIFLIVVCAAASTGITVYAVLHTKSMSLEEIGNSYISTLMSVVCISRVATITFSNDYRLLGKYFVEKFHLYFYKDRSEFAMKTHKQVHKISHFFTIYLTIEMICGLILYNFAPIFTNYVSGNYQKGGLKANATYDHAINFSFPFNASSNMYGYIIANIVNWFISVMYSLWFCVLDCFLSLMVFQIWGHFKVLLYDLDNFPRPASKTNFTLTENSNITFTNEAFSTEELKQVAVRLKECVEYHREIIKFTNTMSVVFGPSLFVYYVFHQTSGCLLLLECSQMTAAALTRYLPLTIILFQQLIQLSIIFELIGSTSARLKDAVYGLPWECMDVKNKRTVLIFLMNIQEPIHVKALGLADVGVTTMATILKTSLTYFTFLKTI